MLLRYYGLMLPLGLASLWGAFNPRSIASEPIRKAAGIEQLLKESALERIEEQILKRGDPIRGALLFFKSSASCSKCHDPFSDVQTLGPNLALLTSKEPNLTNAHLIESLLEPSNKIRSGYETQSFQLADGSNITGIVISDAADSIELRTLADPLSPFKILKSEVVDRRKSNVSLMPSGLIASLRDEADFFDLGRYVFEIVRGGKNRATELHPSAKELAAKEDWLNLDHAGILQGLKQKDLEVGKTIYEGYCADCHGLDGLKPSLPTARAFASQPMKFGGDPFRMFITLTNGNGLMGEMSHLTPFERYQVVHYLREGLMKKSNPSYAPIDREYLARLPKGTDDGKSLPIVDRDLGPALASQLERRFRSALSIPMGHFTYAYDLHTCNQADIWQGGFLDLSETQHQRPRGEGVPVRIGSSIAALQGWQWGHDGTLDYPRDGLLPRGPLPEHWMKYRGYYLDGRKVILSYRIDDREILEHVSIQGKSDRESTTTILHELEIGSGNDLLLAVAQPNFDTSARLETIDLADGLRGMLVKRVRENLLVEFVAAFALGDFQDCRWKLDEKGRITWTIPKNSGTQSGVVITAHGTNVEDWNQLQQFLLEKQRAVSKQLALSKRIAAPTSRQATLDHLNHRIWPESFDTVGYLGLQRGAYALDTLTIPKSTPYNTWFRTTALDFFSDGRMAVTTHGGDVWIVSGVDQELLHLRWKRFAAGLYEPMGIKIIDDKIYVTCKDRLLRLHDRDGNGEADFYESFNADDDISFNFHAFNFDLQTDLDGNFYYSKGGNGSDMKLPGAVIKVSKDGSRRSYFSTGFRAPNGMGTLPDGSLTCSDNQGQWMPASKVSVVRDGGFYGFVQTYSGKDKWAPDGGRIDIKKVVAPTSFDPPMIWLPQSFDNSSGGQIWVDDARWGPLSGKLLHTSFGKGWMSYLMPQKIDGLYQASAIRLPLNFRTGIMRGRVNPRDGQVYVTGLQGWNGGGRIGLLDQGIQRVRFTGRHENLLANCQVDSNGLVLDFNFELDADSIHVPDAFEASHWNYKWQASYGSDMYSPSTGKVGVDTLPLEKVEIDSSKRRIKLYLRGLQPVNQLHLKMRLKDKQGESFEEEVLWTIHQLPT